MDSNNYNLAKYIGMAVNNPKKYPSRPLLSEYMEKEDLLSHEMSVKDMQRVAQSITYKLGGKVK